MKKLKIETIENIQIYRVKTSDRYIAVSRKRGAIININYMQGCHDEELQLFKDDYLADDKELTDFILDRINGYECEIEEIDRLIWKRIDLEDLGKLKISNKLNSMLNDAGISATQFYKYAEAEDFTQPEINDLSYMEDKINIWREIKSIIISINLK